MPYELTKNRTRPLVRQMLQPQSPQSSKYGGATASPDRTPREIAMSSLLRDFLDPSEKNPNLTTDSTELKGKQVIDLGNGSEVIHVPRFVPREQAWQWYEYLDKHIPWTRPTIRVFGKSSIQVCLQKVQLNCQNFLHIHRKIIFFSPFFRVVCSLEIRATQLVKGFQI